MATFKPYDPGQRVMFPPNLGDLVAEDHLARVVSEVLDTLDVSRIEAQYASIGQRAYAPRMLLKLLFYGSAIGVRSSRQLAQATYENVVFMWLAGGQTPDFRTIADFRKRHNEALEDLFEQIVRHCFALNLVTLGRWSVDGTRIQANAGKKALASRDTLDAEIADITRQIKEALAEATAQDAAEDEAGAPDDNHRVPPAIARKQDRLARLERAKETLDAHPKRKRANRTDPDAPLMARRGKETLVAYNAQATVDADSQVILAVDVGPESADAPALLPQIDQACARVGHQPEALLADAGYTGIANIEGLEARGITPYIPQRSANPKGSDRFSHTDFIYDEASNSYRCPAGKTLDYWNRKTVVSKSGNYRASRYRIKECGPCEFTSRCHQITTQDKKKQPQRGRTLSVADAEEAYQENKRRLETPEGRAIYDARGQSSEPVFGVIKSVMGVRQFLVRGARNVKGELHLIAAAFNLRKIHAARNARTCIPTYAPVPA